MTHRPRAEELLEHQDFLRRLARRLVRDEASADDVVQEAWVAALRQRGLAGESLRGWLATAVRHLAINAARGERRRRDRERRGARPEAVPDPRDVERRLEAQRELLEALRDLREPYRTALYLRYHEDLSPPRVAARLGVPLATAKTRLRRGLELLREQLDGPAGDRRSWCLALVPSAVAAASWHELAGASVGPWLAARGPWTLSLRAGLAVAVGVAGVVGVRAVLAPGAGAPSAGAPGPAADEAGGAVPTRATRRVAAGPRPTAEVPAAPALGSLRVLDADGIPVEGLRAAWLGEDGALELATTGEGGLVALPCPGGAATPGELVARLPGGPLVRAAGTLASDRTGDVRLPRPAVLAGRVRVDGAAPGAPLELTATARSAPLDAADLPRPAREFLRVHPGGAMRVGATAAADGTFRIEGLEPSWSGTLFLPPELVLREPSASGPGPRWLLVDGPTADLEVDATRLPLVAGRVVRPGGGAVGDARVTLRGPGDDAPFEAARAGEDGRFALPRADLGPLVLELAAPDGRGARRVELEGVPGDAAWPERARAAARDLGDLALAPTRDVVLWIEGAGGEPVPDARARCVGLALPEGRAGDGGRCELPGLPLEEALRVRVDALGWIGREVELGPRSEQLVRLERAARLAVRVRDGRGEPARSARVALRGAPAPAADLRRELPSRPVGELAGDGAPVFAADAEGRVEVVGLPAGLALEVVLLDRLGARAGRWPVAPLAAGEARELDVVLPAPPRALEGRVVDAAGRPLANALVRARAADGPEGARQRTDADGRFRFADVLAERARLLVRKPGHARRALDVAVDGAPRTVVLEPGLELAVEVRDARGRLQPGGRLAARGLAGDLGDASGEPIAADEVGAGLFVLRDLAAGGLELELELAGATLRTRADAAAGLVLLSVPPHGAAHVHWERPGELDGRAPLAVELVPDEPSREPLRCELPPGFAGGSASFPALAPGAWRARLVSGPEVLRERAFALVGDGVAEVLVGP